MANHLFIIPGYSDVTFSFRPLRNLLINHDLYLAQNIFSIEYASLDDQVDYYDFADKLEEVYRKFQEENPGQRVDVLAHSTGSLVVRAWLFLRRCRQKKQDLPLDVPVEHLFLFAPANFGSDLAVLGRSALNAVRVTFTKMKMESFMLPGSLDSFETGRRILEGLEPASPVQWQLSVGDLHQETYFGENDETGLCCFPFVFAAGTFNKTLESIGVRELQKDGTDSTVRIAGTSLNTRLFTLRSDLPEGLSGTSRIYMESEFIGNTTKRRKFGEVAFGIFSDYDHCGIINQNGMFPKPRNSHDAVSWNPQLPADQWKPLPYLIAAMQVSTSQQYVEVCEEFKTLTNAYIENRREDPEKGIYQQFFFQVLDDTDQKVRDFFVQFLVGNQIDNIFSENSVLTRKFQSLFGDKTQFHFHLVDNSHAMLMLDLSSVNKFITLDLAEGDQVKLRIIARSPYNGVRYPDGDFIVFQKGSELDSEGETFFFPYTTTLVRVILGRSVDDSLLSIGTFGPGGGPVITA